MKAFGDGRSMVAASWRRTGRAWGSCVMVGLVLWLATAGCQLQPDDPFQARDMWGNPHRLGGDDWLLFDFVHSAGCGYCVLNAGEYQANFADGLAPAGVRTFGISLWDDQRDLLDYVRHHEIAYPILTFPFDLWTRYRCPGLPGQTLWHDGRLLYGSVQTCTHEAYERIARELVAAGRLDEVPPFRVGGPLKKSSNAIYESDRALVVLPEGDDWHLSDCFAGLTRIVFQHARPGEILADSLADRALYLWGTPRENTWVQEALAAVPFEVAPDGISFADTTLHGADLRLVLTWPNPWSGCRPMILQTGTGKSARYGHVFERAQDFVISRVTDEGDGVRTEVVARGLFSKQGGVWGLRRGDIEWAGRSAVATPPPLGCPPDGCPVPALAATPAPAHAGGSRPVNTPALQPDAPVRSDPLGPGRFPALAAGAGSCWVAADVPGKGIRLLCHTGHSSQSLWVREHPAAYAATLARSPDGDLHVAWTEEDSARVMRIAGARLRGGRIRDRYTLSHRPNLDHGGAWLTAAADGSVRLTWNTWEANGRLGYGRRHAEGAWGPVCRLPEYEPSGFAWYHRGAALGQGAASQPTAPPLDKTGVAPPANTSLHVWTQHYPHPTGVYAALVRGDVWEEPAELSAAGRYAAVATCGAPSRVPDGSVRDVPGDVLAAVVWQEPVAAKSGRLRVAEDLWFAEYGTRGWRQPEKVPGIPAGRNVTPVAALGGGRLWVCWSHHAGADGHWRLLLAARGEDGWEGLFEISLPGRDARSPVICHDAGELWIAWQEGRGAGTGIRLAHIDLACGIIHPEVG